MIRVEKVIEKTKADAKVVNAVNNEKFATGRIKAVTQSYWPYIITVALAIIAGVVLWKKGKTSNGEIPG
jgi:hypothetical protein